MWNISKYTSNFWNDCSVGISWITNQGLRTCYFSAFTSVLCALLLLGKAVKLWSPMYVVMTVFSFDEAQWGGGNRRKTCKTQLLSWKRKESHPESCLFSSSTLPASCEAVLICRKLSVSVIQLPTDASPCSAIELGGQDLSTQKWMNNLNNMNCDLLYTHFRLDTFICNLYHISEGKVGPISLMRKLRFIKVRSMKQASGRAGIQTWIRWVQNCSSSHYNMSLSSPWHRWIVVKLNTCWETPHFLWND